MMKTIKLYMHDDILEGLLIKDDAKHYIIKLPSGYNVGISKNRVDRVETADAAPAHISKSSSHSADVQDTKLPRILILHTGGTIASKVDYKTGAVVAQFEPSELLSLFPELGQIANIESSLLRNMMSDDMRFGHYNLIASEIKRQIDNDPDLKGVIITHGTDTLHYTSAALSFMLEGLSIPVMLVGSQRSSDRPSSDSPMNLVCAVAFAANTHLSGVFICMHENMSDDNCIILDGINARKMHSTRRDAFRQINSMPVARIDFKTKNIEYISGYDAPLTVKGKLKIITLKEDLKIGFAISHPNMHASELKTYLEGFDGLVLEGTGIGHFPIGEFDEYTKEHSEIKKTLSQITSKIPVVMSVQTIEGPVKLNVYSPGREMISMGIIGNHSTLTPETAFIKLAWLLSQELDVKENFMKDFRGEFRAGLE